MPENSLHLIFQVHLINLENDIKCVRLAGLCHDLGHGPFSHVFDGEFIKRVKPDLDWSHEDASLMMFEDLINSNGINDVSTSDISFIKQLIVGSTNPYNERAFLFDIVANKRNSIDVDKFDYLARDCLNVGIKNSYDSSRLMKFCRVIDNQICYNKNDAFNVYHLFQTRVFTILI